MSSQGVVPFPREATAPEEDAKSEATEATAPVTCEPSGEVAEVPPGTSVLDAALDQGIDLDHGCRAGACGACAVEVVEGIENADEADPIEENTRARCDLGPRERLACRMTCRGPMKIRPLD